MKLKITGQIDGKSVPITVPIEKVIEAFWPYATKPSTLSVSTDLESDSISADFMLGQETKDSIPVSGSPAKTAILAAPVPGSVWNCRMKPTIWLKDFCTVVTMQRNLMIICYHCRRHSQYNDDSKRVFG